MTRFFFALALLLSPFISFAQQGKDLQNLRVYHDSLTSLGKKFINSPDDIERKNANYKFITTLVSALRVPNSFNFGFDSVKSISIINAPDNRFRIFSWHVMNQDGSYRYYGTIQMNTGGKLQMYPLEDNSPFIKHPEDSVTDTRHWYGAQYYKIIRTSADRPYYVMLGWKGNNVKSTKKVIEVLSFNRDNQPVFGAPVFDGGIVKNRKRVVFEYTRQASMLLRYVPDEQLIVFDHLAPPDDKMKDRPETFGPDLSYDGYRMTNGRWKFTENLDMRNIPQANDNELTDPKIQARADRKSVPVRSKN
ncbi:hypothetical protein FPZ43_03610 [Mucilaginibacter pallidiroseus]|uniref:Uncharacterized protein n=1 Tax=Mucilaginibacter pallidiroseus TaxID=2599295 RepID=A0A563UJQ3_9SPHI|nr:hypothetical protein [Mucilaginibacter pallidiroseus]TWR31571.1 hypothetical protein FPZ43_03610 [Mucilaginibacter pallidiroseus]